MSECPLQTVVESPGFAARVVDLLGEIGRDELIDHIARNPYDGDVIPDSGGIRKLRWAVPGRGRRGGARVVYYVYNADFPVFLLQIYAKNRKVDIAPDERRKLKTLLPILLREYGGSGR